MLVDDSFELFHKLFKLELLKASPPFWWPEYGTYEVILGAILTQNSRFDKVLVSLSNLRLAGLDQLHSWQGVKASTIEPYIVPSGLYRQKSQRLIALADAIIEDFRDFDTFVKVVDRAWLLEQKGIGQESADAILCYACQRDVMVVDAYTARILEGLGFTFQSYEEIQDWLVEGIEANRTRLSELYKDENTLATIYAHFHGMIVEYAKKYSKGRSVDLSVLI